MENWQILVFVVAGLVMVAALGFVVFHLVKTRKGKAEVEEKLSTSLEELANTFRAKRDAIIGNDAMAEKKRNDAVIAAEQELVKTKRADREAMQKAADAVLEKVSEVLGDFGDLNSLQKEVKKAKSDFDPNDIEEVV